MPNSDKIILNQSNNDIFTLIEVILTEAIAPDDLRKIDSIPDIIAQNRAHLGVVLSGRAPLWLYGFLSHHYHPSVWVGFYDPRYNGAIVVQSHTVQYPVGQIVPVKINV